jgi:hypothetical protein
MIQLQSDTTSIINTNGFSDNFFWPLILALAVFIFGAIWKYLKRKKIEITVNHAKSFIGTDNGHDYAIINISIINETANSINNLRIVSTPSYNFKSGVWGMTLGSKSQKQTIFPTPVKLTTDEIDASKPINIGAENSLEGNLIIDIHSRTNHVNNIGFNYLTKRIQLDINFNGLKIKQL